MVYKLEGIILKKKDVAGYDRFFWVYTKQRGKILLKGKSVRKKESKLKGYLDIFNHNHFLVAQGKTIDTITNVWPENSWPKIKQDLDRLWSAYYMAELVDRLIVEPESDLAIWRLILGFLSQLEKDVDGREKLLRFFEYKLIDYLGYRPEEKIVIVNWQNFFPTQKQLQRIELLSKKIIKRLLNGAPQSARFLNLPA